MRKTVAMALAAFAAAVCAIVAQAMPEIPKASAKALGVTRGKAFSSGLLFVNGKYVPPPYVVERWGTGIRINGQQVTGQVVEWTEFVKTQSGVKVTRSEAPAEATPAPQPAEAAPAAASNDDDDSSLDDLFDDDPKPKKKAPMKSLRRPPAPRKPSVTVSYSLDGDFVPNDASRALLAKVNAARTEIDKRLRSGGFIFFGDMYSRIDGDSGTALKILEKVPELQRQSDNQQQFYSAIRAAGLVYLHEQICADLFANRLDYRKLQERRTKWKKDLEWKQMLDGVSDPLF